MENETDTKNPAQEEEITIKLVNMGTVNKNRVSIAKGIHELNLYFSYQTLVGINQYACINEWSTTTGKLLNEIQPDKSRRIPKKELDAKAQELIKSLLYGVEA